MAKSKKAIAESILNNLRASGPKQSLSMLTRMVKGSPSLGSTLGPLTELPGKWVGPGLNVIALPDFAGGTKFRVMVNSTNETMEFTDDVGPVPNRGNTQPDITFKGLRYLQTVSDAPTGEGLHIEPGLMLNLPKNNVQKQPTVVRMGTVPHGDALLGQGTHFIFNGEPQFRKADATPFTLNPDTGARINDKSKEYLSAYKDAVKPAGISLREVMNPNLLLSQANKQQKDKGAKFLSTVVMQFDSTPVGGINGTPVSPEPINVGGITNIPFVVKNANANSMSSIFWINTLQRPDGSKFMMLQYTQTVILDFPVPGPDGQMVDIKWPHISIATMLKR